MALAQALQDLEATELEGGRLRTQLYEIQDRIHKVTDVLQEVARNNGYSLIEGDWADNVIHFLKMVPPKT